MKSIIYNVYRNGAAGFSNLVMSIELGVIMSVLTDRVLILKGNITPPANVVQYDRGVSNAHMSRVTDLIDLGVPWIDIDQINSAAFVPYDICDKPAWDSVYYAPENLSLENDDFRSFAGGRTKFVTVGEELREVPALLFSGGSDANTLSYYSYFFYLDRSAQLQTLDALTRIKPKAEYADFSNRIIQDLGSFNAVHIRRGDFKVTKGVTTLDRMPNEAVEMLDHHFSRDELLVILTDEANDPFFAEIMSAYKNHLFIDHHILEYFGTDFGDLPRHDSIALAYISQLVAAHSQDFMGTMTSTFTGLIQRMRSNWGKNVPFKFLWDELPPPGVKIKPGSHPRGNEIPLDKGVMIEQQEGPYSWNRFNQRLNPAWMREWPESFLDETAMMERSQNREFVVSHPTEETKFASLEVREDVDGYRVAFMSDTVIAGSNTAGVVKSIGGLFAMMESSDDKLPIGHVHIEEEGDRSKLLIDGKVTGRVSTSDKLLRTLYREVVRLFIFAHPELVWLHAGCAVSPSGAIVLPGPWGHGKSTLTLELYKSGWSYLSDDIVAIDPGVGAAVPFPSTPQMRSAGKRTLSRDQVSNLSKSAVQLEPGRVAQKPGAVSMFVFPTFLEGAKANLVAVPPAQSVGQLLENCISFPNNSDETIQDLCSMVEDTTVYNLVFSDAASAVKMLKDAMASAKDIGLSERAG